MATFRYQSGVMMSENSAKYDAYRESSLNISHMIQRDLQAVSKGAA